jgi:hypothetical protein
LPVAKSSDKKKMKKALRLSKRGPYRYIDALR